MSAERPRPPRTILARDGVRLALHPLNDAEADAPVVLFVHALGFAGAMYGPMAHALGRGYRGFGLDLRFHGGSEAPEAPDFHWRAFGGDVLAALTAFEGVPRIHAYGHSLGGAAIVLAASRAPERFASLHLYEPVIPPPGTMGPEDGPNPLAELTERRRARFASRDAARANFECKPPFAQFDPRVREAYLAHALVDEADGSVALRCRPAHESRLYRTAGGSGAWGATAHVAAPTFCAMGREDEGVASFTARVASALGAGAPTRHPALDHFGPFVAPEALAAVLGSELRTLRP